MGAIRVMVRVSNPSDPERFWEGPFLIDTGAIDSLMPRSVLESIGVPPMDHTSYEMANGTRMDVYVGTANFSLMGRTVGATVAMVDKDVDPLLGCTVLESAGIIVDPKRQELRRQETGIMRGMGGRGRVV